MDENPDHDREEVPGRLAHEHAAAGGRGHAAASRRGEGGYGHEAAPVRPAAVQAPVN